ncbi:ATP-binding protein [Marinicellulosiphila megalodicopiae]|uniref:hybrid sensor histidine kinase/response regulator n=1 Tax=Marinicellulosiphila megalodicopiae TaxID=2724896 RepID=UPI003BAF67D3
MIVDQTTDFAYINVLPYTYQLDPEFSESTIESVKSDQYEPHYSLVSNQKSFQYDVTTGKIWLSFSIYSLLNEPKTLHAATNALDIYSADFYHTQNNQILSNQKIGLKYSFAQMEGSLANHDFSFNLQPGENRFFIKLEFKETISFPIFITQAQNILQTHFLKIFLVGIGISFTLMLLGFSIWLKFHRSSIVPITMFSMLISLAGFQISNANLFTLFFTNTPSMDIEIRYFFGYLFTASLLIFNLNYIQIEKVTKQVLTTLIILSVIFYTIFLMYLEIINSILNISLCLINIISSCIIIIKLKKFEQRSHQSLLLLFFIVITIALIYSLAIFNYFGDSWSLFITTQILMCLVPFILSLTIYHTYKESMIQENPSRNAVNSQHWPLLRKINHDLRSPINAVLGMTELLQDMQLSLNQQSYINTVQTAGFQLLSYVDEIQNLVRIGNQSLPVQTQEINILQFINQLIQPYLRITQSKSIEVIVNTAPNLPNSIVANEKLLLQTLRSILDNAVNFTESGEIEIQVIITEKNKIRFTIRDSGNGISQEILQNIFEFSSWDSKGHQRSHLGLPIAKALVEKMNGHLNLTSNSRNGTKICIDLPLTISKHANINPTDYQVLNDIKVLIVDDNSTCRKVLELQVAELGMRHASANNGQTAIAMLRNEYQKNDPFDLILLDHQMPNMTGVDLLQRIRDDHKVNKNIKTIILTGLDININDELVQKVNICSVLNKPVSSNELRNQLLKAIEK